jgi:hypothetical protein
MAAMKLTREQMIEKLMNLHEGSKVLQDGKTYTVLSISEPRGKLCIRSLAILEDGRPMSTTVQGIGLAKGKTFERSNWLRVEWRAQRPYMDFEVIG